MKEGIQRKQWGNANKITHRLRRQGDSTDDEDGDVNLNEEGEYIGEQCVLAEAVSSDNEGQMSTDGNEEERKGRKRRRTIFFLEEEAGEPQQQPGLLCKGQRPHKDRVNVGDRGDDEGEKDKENQPPPLQNTCTKKRATTEGGEDEGAYSKRSRRS